VDLDTLPEEAAREAAGVGPKGDAFLEGEVPRAVYGAAVEAFPDDTPFHLSLIAVLRIFPRTGRLVDEAYAGLGDGPAAVVARCLRPAAEMAADGPDVAIEEATNDVIANFEAAMADADAATQAALGDGLADFVESVASDTGLAVALPLATVRKLCERFGPAAGPRLCVLWCSLTAASPDMPAVAKGEVYQTVFRGLAEAGLAADAADTAMRWAAEVSAADGPDAADAVYSSAAELLVDGVDKVRLAEHRLDIAVGLRGAGAVAAAFEAAMHAATMAALASRGDPSRADALAALVIRRVHWTWAEDGAAAARAVYAKHLRGTAVAPGWTFFGGAVDFEAAQPEVDVTKVRGLLEKAVAAEGEVSPVPWLRYLEFEAGAGQHSRVGLVYDRALRTLRNPVPFITEARLRQIELAA